MLFVSSSSIRLWKLDAYSDLPAINRGFGGSQIADSIHFADRIVLPYQPRTIVMYAGDNDIAAKKSPEQVAGDFRTFCELVHDKLPQCQILFVAIKPSISRWSLIDQVRSANEKIANYCDQQKHATFIDIYTPMLNAEGTPRPELFVKDGLHMSKQGYEVWEKALQPYLVPAK